MTRACIFLAVFLVTVIFSMADMQIRTEKNQAIQSDGKWHACFAGLTEEEGQLLSARPKIQEISWYGVTNYGLDMGYTVSGTQTVLCGFDGNQSAIETVKAGSLTIDIAQMGYDMGYKAVEAAVKVLDGDKVDSFIDSGSKVIDSGNIEDYIADMKSKGLWE